MQQMPAAGGQHALAQTSLEMVLRAPGKEGTFL